MAPAEGGGRAHGRFQEAAADELDAARHHVRAALLRAVQPLGERRRARQDRGAVEARVRGGRFLGVDHLRRRVPPQRAAHGSLGRARHHPPRGRRLGRHEPRDGRGVLADEKRRARSRRLHHGDHRAQRREHVLPELRGRVDREGQRALVPRARARRARRRLRDPDLARALLRLRREPHPRGRGREPHDARVHRAVRCARAVLRDRLLRHPRHAEGRRAEGLRHGGRVERRGGRAADAGAGRRR